MISIEELNEVKAKKKTSLYYEEKEYLQYIFLNALSKSADRFTFKGGTCLRICYNLERASEDLDFSTKLSLKEVKGVVNECLKGFDLLGINNKIYTIKEFEGNLRIEARFEGPLFNGNPSSTNTLKIDFNKRKVKSAVAKVVPQIFSDVPVFTIVALDEKEILAEKIRTLINRSQPRDLYDIWVLLNKGAPLDKKLLKTKLKEENAKIDSLKLPSKQSYERDLKELLSYLPPYEQVKEYVAKKLKLNL